MPITDSIIRKPVTPHSPERGKEWRSYLANFTSKLARAYSLRPGLEA